MTKKKIYEFWKVNSVGCHPKSNMSCKNQTTNLEDKLEVCYTCCGECYKFLQHSLQEIKWFKKLEVCRGAPFGHWTLFCVSVQNNDSYLKL